MEGLSIECIVPPDPYSIIDRKINTLENMSAECGALLAKVAIRQSKITITRQQPQLSLRDVTLVRR